jgi:hypothetical protein
VNPSQRQFEPLYSSLYRVLNNELNQVLKLLRTTFRIDRVLWIILVLMLWGCGGGESNGVASGEGDDGSAATTDVLADAQGFLADGANAEFSDGSQETGEQLDTQDTASEMFTVLIEVEVYLDGVLSPDTMVVQGGNTARWTTGADGRVTVEADLTVGGDIFVMASHPEARIRGGHVFADTLAPIIIELTRFDTSDNEDYVFKDPGEPGKSDVIEKCAHCHVTINEGWFDSSHKTSASNPMLQDLYLGRGHGWTSQQSCEAQGGSWTEGVAPGTQDMAMHCQLGVGVKDYGSNGACADCHAPGIDGAVGGRDLSEASGYSYDYGIHCDVCHHVESVNLDLEAGVAGRLNILRPSEIPPFEGVGEFLPLTFCPDPENPNLYMGCSQRDHFRESRFCAGCHELAQEVLDPQAVIDASRWPSGRLAVHTTYSEWEDSAMNPYVSCQSCHMPTADPSVINAADLQHFGEVNTGIAGGWPRPYGSVRQHTWSGPRSPETVKLGNPLTVSFTNEEVVDGVMSVDVSVENVGAGHAIPTGEPLRSTILLVSASCETEELKAIGGDVVPDFGGYLTRKTSDEDWSQWPQAQAGQVVRVTRLTGDHRDYKGFGPFGDGTFSAEQKGMPTEEVLGEATILEVSGGVVTLDAELPEGGDLAYLADDSVVEGSEVPQTLAGRAGFGFARVLVGADGKRMVPHFQAVDIASDNRILPGESSTSSHRFDSSCSDPRVKVTLIQRALPYALASERGWTARDVVTTFTDAVP